MTAWLLEKLNTSNPDLLRAASRIVKKAQPDHNGCIKWVGGFNNSGHPIISIASRARGVKTVVIEIVKGNAIDYSVYIENTCGNKSCVNYEHFKFVSKRERAYKALALLGKAPRTDVDIDALRHDRDISGLPYAALKAKYKLSYTQIIRRIGLRPLTLEKRKNKRRRIEGITLTARDVLLLVRKLRLPEENVLAALDSIRRKKRPPCP